MWKILQGMTVFLGLAVLATGAEAAKYKEMDVTDGGSISGKVSVDAAKAESEGFLISKDPEVCGTGERSVDWVRTNEGVLLDTVVYLEKVKAGKAFAPGSKTVKIDQKECTFLLVNIRSMFGLLILLLKPLSGTMPIRLLTRRGE